MATVSAREAVYRRSKRAVRTAVERTVVDPPAGGRFTRPLYWAMAPHVYRWRYPTDFDDSNATPSPFERVRIDPATVTRFTRRWYPPWRRRRALFGAVMDGDWDRRPHDDAPTYGGPPEELFHAERIEDGLLYRALESRFVEGLPWEDTEFVQRVFEYLDAGRYPVWHDCTSRADVLARCRTLEDIAESLEQKGCLSYLERTPPRERDGGFLRALEQEILVDVGRDGDLLLVSGKHRLCLARVHGLDSVPVCFLVRHADWMETRRAVADGTEQWWNHPDLRDLR